MKNPSNIIYLYYDSVISRSGCVHLTIRSVFNRKKNYQSLVQLQMTPIFINVSLLILFLWELTILFCSRNIWNVWRYANKLFALFRVRNILTKYLYTTLITNSHVVWNLYMLKVPNTIINTTLPYNKPKHIRTRIKCTFCIISSRKPSYTRT